MAAAVDIPALLEPIRKERARLQAELDTLDRIIALANGKPPTVARERKRKRAKPKRKFGGPSEAKITALADYLRRTVGGGTVFALTDLEGWAGFEELELGSQAGDAIRLLVANGTLERAERAEHPNPAAIGPAAKFYRVAGSPPPPPLTLTP